MLSFIRSLKATSSYKNTCRGFSGFSSIKPITITRISLRRIGRIRTLNENLMLFVQKTGRYEPLLKNWIFQQRLTFRRTTLGSANPRICSYSSDLCSCKKKRPNTFLWTRIRFFQRRCKTSINSSPIHKFDLFDDWILSFCDFS